ncbi:melanocyte-stimulating hormone receptor-like [Oculina patagonica]
MKNYTGFMNNEPKRDDLATKGDHFRPETFVIINCILNVPLMLISIIGNALVLAAIIRTPSIRSTSVMMLCSLAVSDLLVGFIAQPLFIADELIKVNHVLYRASAMIGFAICGVSLATMTVISIDRFLALRHHMRYATLVTKSRVIYTIVMIWFVNFICPVFHIWDKLAFHFMSAIVTGICLTISAFCYIRIYLIVRQHQFQIHALQQAVQCGFAGNNGTRMLRLKRSAVNTFVFYIFMVGCYFPSYVLLTLFGLGYKEWATEWTISTTILFMNSSINPILFCWRLRELRMAVLKTARKMLCTQTDQD